MKKAALLTLTTLVLTGLCYAALVLFGNLANGTVKGQVVDTKTGEPIPGVTISAFIEKERKGGVATDLDGNYTLSLPAGTYRIEITAFGYSKNILKNIKVEEAKTLVNNVKLDIEAVKLSDVTIKGSRDSEVSDKVSESISYDWSEDSDGVTTSPTGTFSSSPADGYISSPATIATTSGESATSPSYSGSTPIGSESISRAPAYSLTSGKSTGGKKASESYTVTETKKSAPVKEGAKKSLADVKGESTRFKTTKADEAKKDVDIDAKKEIVSEPDTKAGQLTAGEWSDNRNWNFFKGVIKKADWKGMEPMWGFDLSNRYYVKVTSGSKPQNDVKVVLKNKKGNTIYEGRTDNNGNCYLFAGLVNKEDGDGTMIEVPTSGGTKTVSAGEAGNIRPISVDITRSAKPATKLDVMFMIDATGSMGDEMNYLKEELSDVVRRVKASNEQAVDIRLSANVYRDHGDEYVVRSFPFTTDVSKVLTDLNAQGAGGGGDFEEAVEEGLDDAINKHEWSEDATARILFLVLDAPPHNTPENKAKIQKAIMNAARKGIRIVPITSSGINKETEFLMRFMSAATGGSYVFLTDHSGIGGSHIEPTIGKYDVEFLNNLMVRLINAYLTTES